MSIAASPVALASVVAATSLVAGTLPLVRKWTTNALQMAMGFSGGVLLGAAFLHLMPQAMTLAPRTAGYYILAGFLFLFLFEKYVMVHACEVLECEFHTMGYMAFFGLSVHSLTDGVALGSALLVPGLALPVLVAILAHKAPAALALTTILLKEARTRTAIVVMHLLFALTVPVGAVASVAALGRLETPVLGATVAFAAGTFLHVSLSDILPEIHRHHEGRLKTLAAMLAGLLVMWQAKGLVS